MSKQLIRIMALCAACVSGGAQAQNSAGNSSDTTRSSSTDQSTSPSSSSTYDSSRHFGATGRMGQQEVRASKIAGAEIKNNQGQTVGTINDVIFNPNSGRIDFAVISLSSTTGTESTTSSTSTPTPTPGATTSASSLSSGKLVAVPWMLLRPSATGYGTPGTSATTTTSATMGQPTFVFSGDASRLQTAQAFDQSNWPDISQYSWRQSIYSHFGMTPGSSIGTGSATSPGGAGSSSGRSSSTPQPSPSSPDTTPLQPK